MNSIYDIAFAFLAASAGVFAAFRPIHMLQLESYQGKMYFKWLLRYGTKTAAEYILAGSMGILLHLAWALFYYSSPFISSVLLYAADAAYLAALIYIGLKNQKAKAKKPLVFTSRVKRLCIALFLLSFIVHLKLSFPNMISSWVGILFTGFLRYLPGLLSPIFVLLAHVIMLPLENSTKQWYYKDAKRKLANHKGLIKVGITGSYGKTSTKFILQAILQENFNTLATPSSFNTPMGITRVIREDLKPEHEAFIAEMGARYKGDILELCKLVQPEYAIITSVGKQHLETFGSYEAVIATKTELLDSLPAEGAAFINGDNPDCRKMFEACAIKNKFMFGIDTDGLYIKATDIKVGKDGSSFALVDTQSGESANCSTVLLGRHNILNILAAASLARYLKFSMEQIAGRIRELKPIEHRLELIKGAVTVIDDAFNANPEGTKAALEILKEFAPSRRIIITPGMVELGAEEEALHREFGRNIAAAADFAVLVGLARVEPIRAGLLEAGFPAEHIVQVASLKEATELLPVLAPAGSVVLFENDLPDNYENA
ncbi:MAG TPA: UDP-N-acetylmuramoyl-tripeptide--D-alanyl-D-alanine ligase [Clostridia bacterium]|nr:UDP-N-acetylmuramoyl-tripeptide--D-alanyl-D-alanine ligase [Clostridia bacterium]